MIFFLSGASVTDRLLGGPVPISTAKHFFAILFLWKSCGELCKSGDLVFGTSVGNVLPRPQK